MATRISADEGDKAPFRIKARFLSDRQVFASGPMSGFMATGEDLPDDRAEQDRRDWREQDLKRAISVAEEAGLTSYRVEIAPDGAISIIVGEPEGDAGDMPDFAP